MSNQLKNNKIFIILDLYGLVGIVIASYDPYSKRDLLEYLNNLGCKDIVSDFFYDLENCFDSDTEALREFNDLMCRGCNSIISASQSIYIEMTINFFNTETGDKIFTFLEQRLKEVNDILADYNKLNNEYNGFKIENTPRGNFIYSGLESSQLRDICSRLGGINLRAGYPEIGGVRYKKKIGEASRPVILRERSPEKGELYLDTRHLTYLTKVYTNNSGDINVLPKSLRHFKEREEALIKRIIKAYEGDLDKVTGYISVGGTLSNLQGIRMLRDYFRKIGRTKEKLKELYLRRESLYKKIESNSVEEVKVNQKYLAELIDLNRKLKAIREVHNPLVLVSASAHYSHQKLNEVLSLDVESISCDNEDRIDIKVFKSRLECHMKKTPNRPLIIVVTIGTTQMGAIDLIDKIKNILEIEVLNKGGSYRIHADAAIYGAAVKHMEPRPFKGSLFHYCDSISISNHKLLGTIMTTATFLVRKEIKDALYSDSNFKHYVGTADTTLEGSRSAYFIFEAEMAWEKFINQPDLIQSMLRGTSEVSEYAANMLRKILGSENVKYLGRYTGQGNVIFKLPKGHLKLHEKLLSEYSLMPVKTILGDKLDANCLGISNMLHVDYFVINCILDEIIESLHPDRKPKLFGSYFRESLFEKDKLDDKKKLLTL